METRIGDLPVVLNLPRPGKNQIEATELIQRTAG
jgi:hypothetical protein